MLQEFPRYVRSAVASDYYEGIGKDILGPLYQIYHFGGIGEIVQGERDHVGPPGFQFPEEIPVVLRLEIDEADFVSGAPGRLGDQLQAERFEA